MAKIVTEFSFKDNVSAGLGKVRQSAENAAAGFSKVATTLLSVNSAIQIFSAVSAQFDKIFSSRPVTIKLSAASGMTFDALPPRKFAS